MIKKQIINGKVFLEQRTYYVYHDEVAQRASQPSVITSDEKDFKRLKKLEHGRLANDDSKRS